MLKRFISSSTFHAGLCLSLLALCVFAAFAQSGRRARKPKAPNPAAEATPTTTASPANETKSALTFIVGMDKFGEYSQLPAASSNAVLHRCANRLDEAESVKVEITTQDVGRGQAVARAMAETEKYVVWLHLRPDTFTGRAGTNDNPYNVYIEYSVFAPKTAREITSGRVFPGAYQNKGLIVSRKPSAAYGDFYLIKAAKDTAERILAKFHINEPSKSPIDIAEVMDGGPLTARY